MRFALAILCVVLASAPVAADLLQYRTPDGATGWTDDPSLVPPGAVILGATPESVSPPPPAKPAAAEEPAPPAAQPEVPSEAEQRAWWLDRLRAARLAVDRAASTLREEEQRYEDCLGRVNWALYPRTLSPRTAEDICEDHARDLEAARAAHARAVDYVENGIQDECRRAECLPGWLRE